MISILLAVALVIVLIVAALVVGVLILGSRMNRGVAGSIESLKTSGHPGRIQEILALDDTAAAPQLSNHVFFVRMQEGSLERLTGAERAFRLADEVLLEVNNGGFLQYFTNTACDHAPEAVEALTMIGAARTAALLEEAWGVVGSAGRAEDRETRIRQVLELSEEKKTRIAGLDERFYQDDDGAALLMPFVRKRQEDFLDT
ncbi:MAG: DUF4375 domain-containing protein [Vicinamibacteria bacterium]|nr:DUF4375 domain-containing protein [Vicinamibacteria bacterium]